MKILFTFFNPSGGMDTLNRTRCKALSDRGFECHLLYTMQGGGQQNIHGIRTYIANADEQIRRILASERYDLIVVCSDIVLLQKIRGMNYTGALVFEIQGLGTVDTAYTLMREFLEPVRSNANALLYPRTAHLMELSRHYFPAIPQFCFDDPLDTRQFGYSAYPAKSDPVIGWIGRVEKNKNWQDFLMIGWSLLQQNPGIYLWMFHDETLFEPLERIKFDTAVRMLGLADRLISYSNILHEQMADYMSIIGDSGGFLCSTSITEGFGYAVAEAMLCRCPVLATDSDGVRRLLEHNVTGKFYERGNIQHATEEAESLMKDVKLRKSILSNAEEHIRTHFSSSLYADRFSEMVYELTKK